ncbi:hemin-degrading factor [Pseudohoeflea coraliihabitans]|uniref:Hemin-degrading factor n=1 Tax=Pseudohoeflea coraliihabitans TaxID=2860393 RepID=A0ABS6WRP0_9HYPH|nr:ChuX/HutX family heme-like substrate-binding protein [Pseudohoeflea sp. DP4N28-3]MBW3097709.1 hemin-degrading factor [Pseudohoeflea sp. DP4N28-3]
MTRTLDPAAIRAAAAANPAMRARDLATSLNIAEATYVAAWCGQGTTRLKLDFNLIFQELEALGEVMALTRNESAVHEKIGVYDNFHGGKFAAMMLGEAIDMRMFAKHWVHAFAVESRDGDILRHSLQFFDACGEAVHKIHSRPATRLAAWHDLVARFAHDDQSASVALESKSPISGRPDAEIPLDELRDRWRRMTDTHQFVSILRELDLDRIAAVRAVGDDFAWRIDNASIGAMLQLSATEKLPIMCFVGNPGCIQIHSGPIETIKEMGPWLNVLDPGFNLHLRQDHVKEVWAVRKPTDKGHVTSLEAYDEAGNLIVQFFGKRVEGQDENAVWRRIMEQLPLPHEERAMTA